MERSTESLRKDIDFIDRRISELFEKRMQCVKDIAKIKKENGSPIFDPDREKAVIKKGELSVSPELRPAYSEFMRSVMSVSKKYQSEIISDPDTITVFTSADPYRIKIKYGAIKEIGEFFDLKRKVLLVTDDGVPEEYVNFVSSQCENATVVTLKAGEKSKSIETFTLLQKTMLDLGFTRRDCVVAVGGGVVGDVAGFSASAYMRGIDFYNVPTTLLSQVDSSVGGKTAVNFGGAKNTVGAFYQPKGVLIDPCVLSTLDEVQVASGLAECIKSALIGDFELLDVIESGVTKETLETVIFRAVQVKKKIVELDEKESGIRRKLNLGHTIGHAIEIKSGLTHGECVALGMLPMVSEEIRERLLPIYKTLGLRTTYPVPENIGKIISMDKKSERGKIIAVTVESTGECKLTPMSVEEIEKRARQVLTK